MKRQDFYLLNTSVGHAFLSIIIVYVLTTTLLNSINAQPYYFHYDTLLGYTTATSLLCDTCELTPAGHGMPDASGGLSFGPDGHMYGLSSFQDNIIYKVDLNTGIRTIVFSGSNNVVAMGGFMAMGGGIFYSIPFIGQPSDSLYLWNSNTDTMYAVGQLPYRPYGEMWQVNGDVCYLSWAGTGPRQIIKVNLSSPEDSEVLHEFSADYVIYGLTATPIGNILIGAEHSFFSPGKHIVTLNTTDGTVTQLCKLTKPYSHGSRSMTAMSEHGDSPLYLQVDLDCDDSSGATGDNFYGQPFDCYNTGGVPIADVDVKMLIDARISTMTITITNPIDGQDEILTLTDPLNGIAASGEGTSTLILASEGQARILDFQEALKSIRYDNLNLGPTGGIRHIEVFFETESGNTCEIATAFVDVIELSQHELDLGPDVELCDGSSLWLDTEMSSVIFLWSTGANTSAIEVNEEGSYSVTVSGGLHCPNSDEVEVTLLPLYHLVIDGDSAVCVGENIILTINTDAPFPVDFELSVEPGSSSWYFDVESGYQIFDAPFQPTDYYISSINPSSPACFDLSLAYQTIDIQSGFSHAESVSVCEGDSILLGQSWESAPGNYVVIHDAPQGCDTTVTYTLSLDPIEKIFEWNVACDSSLAGVSLSWLDNPNGCDTLLTRTVTWDAPDSTFIQQTSCMLSEVGVFVTSLSNQYGCDSTIVSTISWIPPSDTTFIFGSSCNPAQIGTFSSMVPGVLGCDSMIMRTILLGSPDTIHLFTTSCDPASLGVFISHLTNTASCDSVIIQTVSFSAQDSVFISGGSCDPDQAGVFVSTHTNQFGCDSIVTANIALLPADESFILTTTCNPADAGVFVTTLVNQFGCDSVIHQTVELLPQEAILLASTTCTATDAGVFVTTLVNQHGCDSIITETITWIPSETTFLTNHTCLPSEVETIETLFTGHDGCDSLVIASTELFPLPQLSLQSGIDYNGFQISCKDAADGMVNALVQGIPPFSYEWFDGSTDPILPNLGAGIYAVTVTDGNGCQIAQEITLTDPESISVGFEIAQPDCFDQQQGSILVIPTGGIGPFTYAINGGPFQASGLFNALGGGVYLVTTADANDCRAEEIISLNVPLLVSVELGDNLLISAGDSAVIEAIVNLPFDSIASLVWTGMDSTACPSCLTQLVSPVITTAYTVSVTTSDGCADQDSLEIQINNTTGMYIPNVFSPNGDGINDVFAFTLSDDVERISSFSIFDRWGNLLYAIESVLPDDPSTAWDGTMQGQTLNPGVFTYRLVLLYKDGQVGVLYGDITLVR